MLVARPYMTDLFFKRTIILLAEHHSESTIGFIMNKPAGIQLGDVLDEWKGISWPVFNGGPVSRDQLFFVHCHGSEIQGSISIGNNLFWGGEYKDAVNLISNRRATQRTLKFLIGYSGWGNGQLMDELENNNWYIQSADDVLLMRNGSVDLWGKALENMDNPTAVFANFPDDPCLN